MNRHLTVALILMVGLITYPVPELALGENSSKPITIGFTTVLSGPWAAWGTSGLNGVLLASEINRNKYSINYQDDRCEPKVALSNVRKFILDSPELIIAGGMEVLEAIAPVAKKESLPIFSLGSITENILKKHNNIIALNAFADLDARYLAPYLASLNTIKSISLVHGTNQVGEAMADQLVVELTKRKIKILSKEAVPVETLDFKDIVTKIVHQNPDSVWVHQSENTLLTFIRQLKQLGYKGEIYTIFTFECDSTKTMAGNFLEDVKYTFPLGQNIANQIKVNFETSYREKHGSMPDENAAIGYDAFFIIDKAISACREKGLECYQNYFSKGLTFNGASGKLHITKTRGAMRPYGIKRYHSGEFEWVEREINIK